MATSVKNTLESLLGTSYRPSESDVAFVESWLPHHPEPQRLLFAAKAGLQARGSVRDESGTELLEAAEDWLNCGSGFLAVSDGMLLAAGHKPRPAPISRYIVRWLNEAVEYDLDLFDTRSKARVIIRFEDKANVSLEVKKSDAEDLIRLLQGRGATCARPDLDPSSFRSRQGRIVPSDDSIFDFD